LFGLGDGFDRIAGGHDADERHEGERPQGLQGDLDDTGNSPRAGFIPHDGQAFPFELIGQGLLSQPQRQPGMFEFFRSHVSNGYMMGAVLSRRWPDSSRGRGIIRIEVAGKVVHEKNQTASLIE
jgi:hypothetical protein